MLRGDVEELVDALAEPRGVLLPRADRAGTPASSSCRGLRPTRAPCRSRCGSNVSACHISSSLMARGRNVVAADQPRLLRVPRCGLGLGPAARRWRRCLSGGTCRPCEQDRRTRRSSSYRSPKEGASMVPCKIHPSTHHARAGRRLLDRYHPRASDCRGPDIFGELRFCRAIYGIGAASCILRGAAGTSVHFAGTSLVVGSSHHMQSNILPTRRALAAIMLALCCESGRRFPC